MWGDFFGKVSRLKGPYLSMPGQGYWLLLVLAASKKYSTGVAETTVL
jgi:hypothetical protein